MSVRARIDRLERRVPAQGCPECGAGGGGPVTFTIAKDGDSSEPCRMCGQPPFVFTIALQRADEDGTDDE